MTRNNKVLILIICALIFLGAIVALVCQFNAEYRRLSDFIFSIQMWKIHSDIVEDQDAVLILWSDKAIEALSWGCLETRAPKDWTSRVSALRKRGEALGATKTPAHEDVRKFIAEIQKMFDENLKSEVFEPYHGYISVLQKELDEILAIK